MAQDKPRNPTQQAPPTSKKRKEAPTTASKASHDANKKQKTDHFRSKQRDARILSTQTSSKAFANGALDVDKFVKAREFEIRALEQGMQRSKKALNRRAFQQVPKELRRRTASHDVRRVPKRLQERAKKEMVEDNTPTVTARRRKPTRHMRLRLETAKRLRALGAQKKREKQADEKVSVTDPDAPPAKVSDPATSDSTKPGTTVKARKARSKRPTLAKPPVPKAKFRKRQIHKSWLPTHLFHAKRAHMTPPSAPLWRFAIALTPTQKSYRPTHRANHARGAVACDTSYMATIGLEGEQRSVEGMLKALDVGRMSNGDAPWGPKGEKWRNGARDLELLVYERESPHHLIAPVTIIWCVPSIENGTKPVGAEKRKRKVFIRVHPSAFYQLWEEVLRLAKVAKPSVSVEDLRFEIGSIEITGPGSMEALLGALWPSLATEDPKAGVENTWTNLAGLTNPSTLPSGALLAFNVQDPRLHFPPRTIKLPNTQDEQNKLLQVLSTWPVDGAQEPAKLFDRIARVRGCKIPSQKAINRRKSLAKPGEYPTALPTDPAIPVLLYATSDALNKKQQGTWTLLAPWKTIQPIWYSVIYYPLSTGQQPRFGGLREQQQLAFEAGRPWFPADYPGTKAGWDWEVQERRRRWDEWNRRPKGKRVSWEKVDLGGGRKGEMGEGWACDWAALLGEKAGSGNARAINGTSNDYSSDDKHKDAPPTPPSKPASLAQLSAAHALELLKPVIGPFGSAGVKLDGKLITVRLRLLTRGVPHTCARVYRLPSASTSAELRSAWLALDPTKQPNRKQSGPKHALPRLPKDAPKHVFQQRLAASLLEPARAGEKQYPACPDSEDLVGFVTAGNFNLAEGQGTGIANLLFEKVFNDATKNVEEGRLCIVRNAGTDVGRLARWEVV